MQYNDDKESHQCGLTSSSSRAWCWPITILRHRQLKCWKTYTEAFEPHGALEIDGSYWALIIEGCSHTNVRLKLEKKTIKDYNLADHDHLKKDIDQTLVRFERMSPGHLRLQTKLPGFNLLKRPLQGRSNLNLIYF